MQDFNNLQNKKILWDVLSNSYPSMLSNNVNTSKNIIDNVSKNITNNVNFQNYSLNQLNKIALQEIVNQFNNINEKTTDKHNKQYIQNSRVEEFNNKLKIHENDLNTIINPVQPKSIDFSDNIDDDQHIIDIDTAVNNLINSRNLDIPHFNIPSNVTISPAGSEIQDLSKNNSSDLSLAPFINKGSMALAGSKSHDETSLMKNNLPSNTKKS